MLFLVTACSFISALIPYLVKIVVQFWCSESEQERHLRRQITDLQAEMATISMVDEFAKYAKIQRKVNKMLEELGNQVNQRLTSFTKLKIGITYGLRALTGVILVILLWMIGDQPVLILPPNWLQPLSTFLSWPTGQPGAVSLASWLLIAGTVSRILTSNIT